MRRVVARVQVGVDGARRGEVGVAHSSADLVRRELRREHQRRERVPEVAEARTVVHLQAAQRGLEVVAAEASHVEHARLGNCVRPRVAARPHQRAGVTRARVRH